jgi:reactive intermediate/imine deaminase
VNDREPALDFANPATMPSSVGYSQVVAVQAARMLYIAGQIALNPAGEVVGPGDLLAQTRQVFANLKAALEAYGATFEHVVKLNYYMVDIRQIPVVRAVRDEYISAHNPPASTAVEVRRLFRDEFLIEIDAVAALRG